MNCRSERAFALVIASARAAHAPYPQRAMSTLPRYCERGAAWLSQLTNGNPDDSLFEYFAAPLTKRVNKKSAERHQKDDAVLFL